MMNATSDEILSEEREIKKMQVEIQKNQLQLQKITTFAIVVTCIVTLCNFLKKK